MMKRLVYLFCITLLPAACKNNTSPVRRQQALRTIIIQPFSGLPAEQANYIFASLKKIYPFVALQPPVGLPQAAWNPGRKRYRADSLINYLKGINPTGSVTLGLTNKDISTTKGSAADWGVMGLGFCPGKACIASCFRLSAAHSAAQLFKVAVHELGHTEGLPHCAVTTCIMKDAEGKMQQRRKSLFVRHAHTTCRHAAGNLSSVYARMNLFTTIFDGISAKNLFYL